MIAVASPRKSYNKENEIDINTWVINNRLCLLVCSDQGVEW